MSCRPDIAQKIVDLLLHDPSTARVWNQQPSMELMEIRDPIDCVVCGAPVPQERVKHKHRRCDSCRRKRA